jgi:alpha-galactosidase
MQEVELNSLDLAAFSAGGVEVKAGQSVSGDSLSIAGQTYNKGIGVRAGSELHIRLDGRRGSRFTALAGIDDRAGKSASAVFYVFTNRGIAFRSGVMHPGDAPQRIEADLKGITELCLFVHPVSGDASGIHADWVDAVFTVQTPPVAMKEEPEERYILTPPPAAAPRINGAKITGASPGKPFLFTVATTGERPVTFAAENLPAGLNLNSGTGVITGTCSEAGTYRVPLTVSNSAGQCRDTLEIVIGGGLALTPHMGWNSWYIHQLNVTQEIMEKSALAMYDLGLVNFGYAYVNIDDGWEIKSGSDDPVVGGPERHPDGTIRTNLNFPDMKRMTDIIHRLGLKAGLYSSPGRTTCGGYAGSFGHEAQDINSYVEWGFDFLKYDWCSYGRNEVESQEPDWLQKPYRQISELIRSAPRDIVLNMCQYGMGEVWKWGKEAGGNSWRTTGDLGWNTQDLSNSMFKIGFFQEKIREYSGPDGWNDPDYLLFGNIYDWKNKKVTLSPYTPSEHYTCMTLWCMMSAPLIFSGEITGLDDFTLNILCNAEVIDVDQDRLGKPGYSIFSEDFVEIWKKELSDGNTAVAIFNRRPVHTFVNVDWKALGYEGKYRVRDLWRQKDIGTAAEAVSFDIPRHGCVMLKLKKDF